MEEEVNYSTLVFRNGRQPPKERKEDPAIYSEVKPKQPAATVPDGEAATNSHFRLLLVFLVIVCFLLLASIISIIIIYINVENKHEANLSVLTAENEQLMAQLRTLENKTEEVSRDRDDLNRTLGVILSFSNFPVNQFCPDKKCQPCQKSWIQFQEKCYFFYNKPSPWMTWEASLKLCQEKTADLLIIDNLQEQEFITNNTKRYHDDFHGFWFGLNKTNNNNWVWIDGRNDTLMYWIDETLGDPGPCALMIPLREPTKSWDPSDCKFLNRYICEADALIWPR
ncbi:C-type lectin domain family 12 member B-like [Embiotoca jacksoni]|uniref:C-type lectin domain family 12 member B-like n=1 Tax=Embiotoca jacksoni TaxID=100190 RepID=UPI0037038276